VRPIVHRAADLGRAAETLAELRLPERPRFVPELVLVPIEGGGVHVLGGDALSLDGASAAWVVRKLVPLLDGTRTFDDLARELAAPAESLRDALHLLHMHGMLEELGGAPDLAVRDDRDGQRSFFARYLRVTGLHANRWRAQEALERTRVAIVGDAEPRELLARMLAEHGVSVVADGEEVDLHVAIASAAEQERLVREQGSRGASWLFADTRALTIGPLTVLGSSACPACVRSQSGAIDDAEAPPATRALWERALVARVAQHVVLFGSGLAQPLAYEHVESWRPSRGDATTRSFIVRLPNCPACGGAAAPETMTLPSGHRENRALLFHGAAQLKPWHIRQPSGIQAHIAPAVLELQANAEIATAGSARVALAEPRREARASALGAARAALIERRDVAAALLDRDRLATILRATFGGRAIPNGGGGRRFVRNVASAGNLGSAEGYVLASDVPGLAAGAYHYVLSSDSLEAIGAASKRGARATIVIASAVARVCSKYQARGYTYAMLDAGVAAHRVTLVARRLGVRARVVECDRDELAMMLGLDGDDVAPQIAIALDEEDA
jgi:SagB-type dehydrogenase family enzyme